jgi:Protein of unknown function (DUF4239)
MDALLALPTYLGAMVAMVAFASFGVVPFYLVSRWLHRYEIPDSTRDFCGRVARSVGTLHALILALVFAEVESRHLEIRRLVMLEAENVLQVGRDLDHFEDASSAQLKRMIVDYAHAVVELEWPSMAEHQLSEEATRLHDLVTDGVMDLTVDTQREHFLQAQLIEDLGAIEGQRHGRLLLGNERLPALFWYTAFIGFAILGATAFVFEATVPNMIVVSGYGLYAGLVLYAILAFSHPFTGPAAVDPAPFNMLIETAGRSWS